MNAWAARGGRRRDVANGRECEINNVEIDGVVYKQDQGLLSKEMCHFSEESKCASVGVNSL
jgi:hypothetical protein